MVLEQIIIPTVSAAAGYILGNWEKILSYKRRAKSEDLDIGEKLMKAINDGRREILEAYEIIEKMDSENRNLKRTNMELTIERDQFKSLVEELKSKLEKVSGDLDACAEQAKKYMPIIQTKGKHENDKN